TLQLPSPFVADLEGLERALRGGGTGRRHRVHRIDASWDATAGDAGLASALEQIVEAALAAADDGVEVLIVSDQAFARGRGGRPPRQPRLPIPSVLAVG